MSRGIGEFELLQEGIPEWGAVGIALLTQLGDVWFLAVVLTVLYWTDTPDRDDIAVLAGAWISGMGLYKGLKQVFGFPRPNQPLLEAELLPRVIQPLYEATAFASGYGFPSGHAVNATIMYVGLAHVLPFGTQRRRFAGAAAIVATVSFSRVALGLHYLVDVITGVAIGLVVLLVVRLTNRSPVDHATATFSLAVGFGTFFALVSEVHPYSVFIVCGSLGMLAGWQSIVLDRRLAVLERSADTLQEVTPRGGLAAVAVLPLFLGLGSFSIRPLYALGGVVGLATAGFIVAPVVRRSAYARRVRSMIRR